MGKIQQEGMQEGIRHTIKKLVKKGRRRFIIAPYEKNGLAVVAKKILNEEFGINELCRVNNEYADGVNLLSVEQLAQINIDGAVILLVSMALETKRVYKEQLSEACPNIKIIDLSLRHGRIVTFNDLVKKTETSLWGCGIVRSVYRKYVDTKEWQREYKDILKGRKVAEKYLKNERGGVSYWVLPHHIGDTLAFLKWIRPIKMFYGNEHINNAIDAGYWQQNKPHIERVVVIAQPVNAAVARLYEEVDDIIVCSVEEARCLYKYINSPIKCHPNIYTQDMGVLHGTLRSYDGSISFKKKYGWDPIQYDLGLPMGYESKMGKPRVAKHEQLAANDYMAKNGIMPLKTVILFPYAYSTAEMSIDFWNRVVDYLKNKGYIIFTSCAPSERELNGTKKMDDLIDKVAALVDLGCRVIGVQSGGMEVMMSVSKNRHNILLSPNVSDSIDYKENMTYLYFGRKSEDKIFIEICTEIERWEFSG